MLAARPIEMHRNAQSPVERRDAMAASTRGPNRRAAAADYALTIFLNPDQYLFSASGDEYDFDRSMADLTCASLESNP